MRLTVVIPTFNEELSLVELHRRLTATLAALPHDYDLLFIDDGSTDGSFAVLSSLYDEDPHVRCLRFRRNCGKSAALAAGFQHAEGDVVITLDADLQDRPEEIPLLLQKIAEGYDLVSGWKRRRNDPWTKVLASRIFNFIVRLFSEVTLHDMNCGLKAYRAEVLREIDVYGDRHRFLPLIAQRQGFRVAEVIVRHDPRSYGKSKFGPARLLHGLLDFLTVLLLTKYTERPGHFFGTSGLISFGTGLALCAYLTGLWLFGQRPIGQRPLLFLGVLLLIVGVQLVSFGLLGEILVNQRRSVQRNAIEKKLWRSGSR